MQPHRKGQRGRPLHILLVEHEPADLLRTTEMLLAEGHEVSTARVAKGLAERVERIQPDVVLMDVLMPELESGQLAKLSAKCRGGSDPVLVVHTKLLRPMLRRVIDVRNVFGIIPKGERESEFIQRFRDLIDRFTSEMVTETFIPRVLGIATSGTYAVTPGPSSSERARKHG